VVADDSVLLREGLVRLLTENGHDVVAAVGDGPSLVHAIEERRPDISVVDVRMPPSHTDEGLRAAVEARRRVPGSPVLVLSQYVEVSYADDLLADDAGAIGYLLKDRVTAITDFLDSVQRVGSGGTVLDREVVAQLLVRRRRDDPLAEMTARELEVLALMAEGRSNTNIARTLQAGSTSLAQVGSAIDAGKVKQIASGPEVGLPGYISVTRQNPGPRRTQTRGRHRRLLPKGHPLPTMGSRASGRDRQSVCVDPAVDRRPSPAGRAHQRIDSRPVGSDDLGTKTEVDLTGLLEKAGFLPRPSTSRSSWTPGTPSRSPRPRSNALDSGPGGRPTTGLLRAKQRGHAP
jgi:DNA-binding NarL/FixJ family response regulator